jgi:hypothetical protein
MNALGRTGFGDPAKVVALVTEPEPRAFTIFHGACGCWSLPRLALNSVGSMLSGC